MRLNKREQVAEVCPDALFLPSYYDHAIIGMMDGVAVYDEDKVLETLMLKEEMDFETASEFYAYNIKGSLGENYPIFVSVLMARDE